MAESGGLRAWTREGWVTYPWADHETVDRLAYTPQVRREVDRVKALFLKGPAVFKDLRIPWSFGTCFYGPSGTGKSAASRAIAKALGWAHCTIPSHEILDSHFLERALAEAVSGQKRVIVLENVDQIIRRMEPEEFFGLLDFSLERSEGIVWIATSRHPELLPKTHLIRPGRLERLVRFDPPDEATRRALWLELLVPHFSSVDSDTGADAAGLDEPALQGLVERSEGLTQGHFEELRRVSARLRLEDRQMELLTEAESYMGEQVLVPDRMGGVSDSTLELRDRVDQVDSRTLLAAMDMADVLKRVMKKVIADAFEDSQRRFASGEPPATQ